MHYNRLLLATLAVWVFGSLWVVATCGWLFNWVYEIPPIIWKSPAEIMMTSNIVGSYLAGILAAFLFVLVYALFYKCTPRKGVKKGLWYGFVVWLVGPLSGVITMPFYMTISTVVIGYWIINMFVSHLVMGALVGAIYKGK